jgi:anti-sigma B factor antagonist
MPPSLVVVEAWSGTSVTLSLVGDLDILGGPRFVSHAADALRRRPRAMLVDMSAVALMDSAGLAALLNTLRRATHAGASMVLIGVPETVHRVFELTRLDREFSFAPTQEVAERLVRQPL